MEYKGTVYAKIGGKYIPCTETVEQLEGKITELENRLKQFNDLPDKRSELLRFFLWFRENGEKYIDMSIERMIDIYLGKKS